MLKDKNNVTFESLFACFTNKAEIVSTFLALLELIRLQALRVLQQEAFGTIFIYSIENNQKTIEALSDAVDEFN
jgi:chromatin segregation and condensation protein Rec8/ScpA/Scc1 (kleisin family)